MIGARTRTAALAVAGLLGVALAGCGAGQDAQTSLDLPSVPGVNVSADDDSVMVRNAHVTFNAESYPAGGEAPVQMWLFNETFEPVQLVDVTSDMATSVTVDGQAQIPPNGWIEVTLTADGLQQPFGGADNLPLELTFDNDAVVALRAPMAPPLENLPREQMDLGGH